ncbi:hypothetical protein ACHAXR_008369 [Thalassiosira sp. AJA248-18]
MLASRISMRCSASKILQHTVVATSQSRNNKLVPPRATLSSLTPPHESRIPSFVIDDSAPNIAESAIDFADPAAAHGTKTTSEIVRAIAVFKICQMPFIVRNADRLLSISNMLLGRTITSTVVKHTFFKHFCAGGDSTDMKRVIDMLQESNVGPILDYAAENEEDESSNGANIMSEGSADGTGIFTQPPFNQPARIYDYKSEEECDRHVSIFKDCIRAVRDISPSSGFAALKVTALGNPELLERMSTIIVETKKLFSKFDTNGTGMLTHDEFGQCYKLYFHTDEDKLANIIQTLDPCNMGRIDYISFAQIMNPYTLPSYTLTCTDVGPLALATPSDDEIMLMKKMCERLETMAQEAVNCGTKLLIDAEHLKYQPAIDSLVLGLQRKYNDKNITHRPVIFNTYQCYLKDASERVNTDMKRSERFGFHFAAKIVRGAYMDHERERAKKLGIESPIHDTIENTHRCYNDVVECLLRYRYHHDPGLEVMVASHNKESIEKAVRTMQSLGIDKNNTAKPSVHFAQLYGMCDNLSFTLGRRGYSAFKYLPYGSVEEVIPYLLRRAQENGDVLGNTDGEVRLLKDELKRRLSFV